MAEICLGLIFLGLTMYAVLGGADFGAGFWDLTAGGDRRGGPVRGLVQRSMSPVWEANHVWLIFVLVMAWTAFPLVFGAVFTTFLVPLFLAALGIIMRGAAFALRGQAATIREARVLGATFALSSVILPFFLGTVLGGIAAGAVDVSDPQPSGAAWTGPVAIAAGLLAVLTGAYLSAVFLAADARRAGVPELERAFRGRALGMGAVTGAAALGSLLVLRSDARPLFDDLTSGAGLAGVLISVAAGGVTLALIATWRFEVARWTAAAAVAAMIGGWWLATRPEVLPGLTLEEAAAPDATLTALVVAVGLGLLILVPSLWYLYRLVLAGTLDQGYEPLDQQFRPSDPEPPR
ncbi:MAG TPA: cytochrome d ubiquinol oxidase subunit II [Solirubrobacteraceae bacterium]|nr:cytochrome d ubiquinol oxidase subunit II [Solirubrobacteraceae bacterium]